MDINWLLGFIEGEGCFTIMLGLSKSYRFGISLSPTFCITLNHKDKEVIYKIKEFIGAGNISEISNQKYRNKGKNYQDCIRIQLCGYISCNKLKKRLEKREWHTKKKNDFDTWCKFIDMFEKKEHLNLAGIKKILKLREKMNLRGNELKRNYNYLPKEKVLQLLNNRRRILCKTCGKECLGSKRYCNKDCRNKYYNKKARENRMGNPDDFKICIICGEKFYRKDFQKTFGYRIMCSNSECKRKKRNEDVTKWYNKNRAKYLRVGNS